MLSTIKIIYPADGIQTSFYIPFAVFTAATALVSVNAGMNQPAVITGNNLIIDPPAPAGAKICLQIEVDYQSYQGNFDYITQELIKQALLDFKNTEGYCENTGGSTVTIDYDLIKTKVLEAISQANLVTDTDFVQLFDEAVVRNNLARGSFTGNDGEIVQQRLYIEGEVIRFAGQTTPLGFDPVAGSPDVFFDKAYLYGAIRANIQGGICCQLVRGGGHIFFLENDASVGATGVVKVSLS